MFRQPSAMQSTRLLINKICNLACKRDKQGIAAILSTGISVSVCYGNFTPLMLLAKKGRDDAVNFMLDEFNVKPQDAVAGYILGGFIDRAFKLLHDEKSSYQFNVSLRAAVQALAKVGQGPLALSWYSPDGPFEDKTIEVNYYMRYALIKGAAELGDSAEVDKILASEWQHVYLSHMYENAVLGFACGGHLELAKQYIANMPNYPNFNNNYRRKNLENYLIYGAATNLGRDEINDIITKWKHSHSNLHLLSEAIQSLAAAGKTQLVTEFLTEHHHDHKLKKAAIIGYAIAGNLPPLLALLATYDRKMETEKNKRRRSKCKVEKFIEDTVIENLASHDHINEVMLILKKIYATSTKLDLRFTAANYRFTSCRGIDAVTILRYMAMVDDVELRKLFYQMASLYEKVRAVDVNQLLRKAARLHHYMSDYQINYKQALLVNKLWTLPREIHIWFLQGVQLIADKRLSLDTFINIASHALQQSPTETFALYQQYLRAIPKLLCDTSTAAVMSRHGMFSHAIASLRGQQCDNGEAAQKVYQKRMSHMH